MPFPSAALTSTQYELLRGTASVNPTYRCRAYTSLCPNTTVVAARVNGTPTGTSFASFAYDTVTSGAIADVKVGQTILLSRTDDRRAAYFTGRVRELPTGSTSGTIYINECSSAVTDNDYVFVIDDFRLWPILARDVSGTQYKDYDNTYAALPPIVTGVQSAYAGFVDSSSGKLRIAFSAAAVATTSGATISSYAWTFGGVTSVVSGATNTATVTIDFDPSAGVWCSLIVTDSGSRTTTRRFIVFPHNDSFPPLTGVDSISVTGDLDSGWSAQMTAFAGLDSVLDNTLTCIWVDERYNSTDGSLLAGTNDKRNISFVGRMRRETNSNQVDPQSGIIVDTPIELEGVGQQLSRLHGALIAEILDASANAFDEIVNLTVWRGIVQLLAFHSTFLSLHDLSFDSTDNTYLCQALRTQGSNLLDVINDLANSINASIEFAPDGACRIYRDPRYISTSARNALTTLAAFTDADYINFSLTVEHVLKIGKVTGDGGMYVNLGSINQVYPYLSIAPGIAQDYAEASSSLPRQVLTANTAGSLAQAELNERVGRHFGVENTLTALSVEHLDGYRWLIPSKGYWFTWTIASTANARGRAYTTSQRWLLLRVQVTFAGDGTCSVQADYLLDIDETTIGAAGDSVVYPDPEGQIFPDLPPLPPIDPYPIPDDVLPTEPPPVEGDPYNPTNPPKNGNTVLTGDADNVWLTTNFLSGTAPTFRDVTPDSAMTYVTGILDPFPNGRRAWVLANDTTDSFVYYTADVFQTTPTWTQGATTTGIYTVLRTTDVDGGIMIYVPNGSVSEDDTGTYDFSSGVQGWSHEVIPPGFSDSGNGENTTFTGTEWLSGHKFTSTGNYTVSIQKEYAANITVTSVRFVGVAPSATMTLRLFGRRASDNVWVDAGTGGAFAFAVNGAYDHTYTTASGNLNGVSVNALHVYLEINDIVNTFTLTDLIIAAAQFPISGGIVTGGSAVAYSTDNGAIWDSVTLAGDSPGAVGAFDTIRVGDVSIAGVDAQAYQATTKGGAYTSLSTDGATSGSDPVLAIIPWSQFGSTSLDNFSTSTPDYFLGSAALVSSHCLWRVDGGGGRTGITPTGATAMISPNCLASYLGTRAAVIASVSGTRTLFTSTNIGSSDTWTSRGATGATSDYIRPLRLSQTLQQLFWVAGAVAKYSADFGATIVTKQTPSTGTLLWIEPYG